MRRLVILRPEPGSRASLERALGMGLDARALPLFRIEPVPWDAPDLSQFDALLLTSASAVRSAGNNLAPLTPLPVYAVGDATAAAAREMGLRVAAVGDCGIEQLLPLIPANLRLLHLCGRHRRTFNAQGHAITPIEVYSAEPLMLEDAADALRGQVAAVHSPRAAARLAELVGGMDRQTVRIAAISPAAAEAVGIGWNAVEFAQFPTDDALLALAARLCEENGQQ